MEKIKIKLAHLACYFIEIIEVINLQRFKSIFVSQVNENYILYKKMKNILYKENDDLNCDVQDYNIAYDYWRA